MKKIGYDLILVLFCKCRDISQPTSSPVGGTLIALDTAVGPDMLMVDRNQLTALDALSAVQAMGVHEEILLLLSVVSQAHIAKSMGLYYIKCKLVQLSEVKLMICAVHICVTASSLHVEHQYYLINKSQ